MPVINARQLSSENLPYLESLFKAAEPSRTGWGFRPYPIKHREGDIELPLDLQIENAIIIKRKNKAGTEDRYEVIDKTPLDRGGYGTVYPIIATLKIGENGLFIKEKAPEKRRVAKITNLVQNKNLDAEIHQKNKKIHEQVTNEYINTLMTDHLHPKCPIIYNNQMIMVLRRMPGRRLNDLIIEDLDHNTLSLEDRFKLTFNLIKAVQEEVVKRGLVHRDLKPENIMVDEDLNVHIIDYGLSKKIGDKVTEDVGSALYVSPEALVENGFRDPTSDYYSLGRILSLVWHDDMSKFARISKETDKVNRTQQASLIAKEEKFDGLCAGLSELAPAAKPLIVEAIKGLSRFDQGQRIDLEKAEVLFTTAQETQCLLADTVSTFSSNTSGPKEKSIASSEELLTQQASKERIDVDEDTQDTEEAILPEIPSPKRGEWLLSGVRRIGANLSKILTRSTGSKNTSSPEGSPSGSPRTDSKLFSRSSTSTSPQPKSPKSPKLPGRISHD